MLDLTKLAALELPQKEVEVSILGEKQKTKIRAFGDDVGLQLLYIRKNHPDDSELHIRRLLLSRCVEELTEEQINLLLERDGKAVWALMEQIIELTDEFDSRRKELREQAEKNSGKEAADTTLS